MSDSSWDVVVAGGGPAGLAASFWLARYRRRVLLLDAGRPRNQAAWAVHGYPGLADPHPGELRDLIRTQATQVGAVFREGRVVAVNGEKDEFRLETDDAALEARRVLLAYGRQDRLPDMPGLADLYGTSVFHCPDCDGPSVTGDSVGVLGHDGPAAELALYLLTWAAGTTLLTNGREPDLTAAATATLARHDVAVRRGRVERLVGSDARLERVELTDGPIELDALFFHWGSDPSSTLGPMSGCVCEEDGGLEVDSTLQTSVPGIYAAGDIIGRPHLAISAAAGGVRAALAIHRSLLPAEFDL